MTIQIGTLPGQRTPGPIGQLSRTPERALPDPVDVVQSSRGQAVAAPTTSLAARLRGRAMSYALVALGGLLGPTMASTVMAAEVPQVTTQPVPSSLASAAHAESGAINAEVFGYLSAAAPQQAAQPYHPAVQKGDYVAHHVNFSNLLSDERFGDWQSMTQPQIQSYLEANHSVLSTYRENGRLASQIVADAAVQNHVNPVVLLATLEKESHLVSRTDPAPAPLLRSAMGYAYPDGGHHHHQGSFTEQVDGGGQLLRQLFDEGTCMKFPAHKAVDFGRRTIKVDNAATWALLRYTPHTVDTHLHQVGGGNYLFHFTFSQTEQQISKLDTGAQTPRLNM